MTVCARKCHKCHYLDPKCVEDQGCSSGCDCPALMAFDGAKCIPSTMCNCLYEKTLLQVRNANYVYNSIPFQI